MKIEALTAERQELTEFLARPDAFADPDFVQKSKRLSSVEELLRFTEKQAQLRQDLAEAKADPALQDLIADLEQELGAATAKLSDLLAPQDPNDQKNAIVEVRAGAGGDEASLFAGELLRMYLRYGENHGLKSEVIAENSNDSGGLKEAVVKFTGEEPYGQLHRLQRVPVTESQGRVHTSTATVAVLPEAEETDVEISPADLRIDVYRAGGHGGQSVNTTDSAVRITHLPTGLVVTNQDEKSQLKNKDKARGILRAKLLQIKIDAENAKLSSDRLKLIGTGDRSEKIRTYNFPQDRITDHRIGYSRSNLPAAMDGQIDDLIEHLHQAEHELSSPAATADH